MRTKEPQVATPGLTQRTSGYAELAPSSTRLMSVISVLLSAPREPGHAETIHLNLVQEGTTPFLTGRDLQ